MPMLPKRCCSDPMCGAVAAPGSSRCPAHARALQRSYDDRRGTTVERGYDSDHQRLRVLCFVRDEWRCKVCGWEPDVVRDCRLAGVDAPPVEVVLDELRRAKLAGERHLHMDHIIRIEDRPELRLDLSNVQTLCSLCHARKTMAERRAPAMVGGTGSRSEKLSMRRGDQRWPCVRESAHENFLFWDDYTEMLSKSTISAAQNAIPLTKMALFPCK